MKNRTIPDIWLRWANVSQYPTAIHRPLVGPKDQAREVLRLLPLMIHKPELIAITAVGSGLNLNGDECLKFTALLASSYAAIIDGMCGNIGDYAVPPALSDVDDSDERAKVVAALDELIAQLR